MNIDSGLDLIWSLNWHWLGHSSTPPSANNTIIITPATINSCTLAVTLRVTQRIFKEEELGIGNDDDSIQSKSVLRSKNSHLKRHFLATKLIDSFWRFHLRVFPPERVSTIWLNNEGAQLLSWVYVSISIYKDLNALKWVTYLTLSAHMATAMSSFVISI